MLLGKTIAHTLVFAAIAACVASCSPASTLPDNQPLVPISTPVSPSEAAKPIPSATSTPSTTTKPVASAEETAQAENKLSQALSALLSFNPEPSTSDIRQYLTGEGIKDSDLQISATTTPTGLKADATEIGWSNQGICIMGFIAENKVSVSTLPALPDDTCFIGVNDGR